MPILKRKNTLFRQDWETSVFYEGNSRVVTIDSREKKGLRMFCWECGGKHEHDCICEEDEPVEEEEPLVCGGCGSESEWFCTCPYEDEFRREPVLPKAWGYESILHRTPNEMELEDRAVEDAVVHAPEEKKISGPFRFPNH